MRSGEGRVPGRVSVITACRDAGPFVAEAAASVRHQTYPDVEHIVVDDGSTDPATLTALEDLEKDAPDGAVRVVRQPPSGVSSARNAAISASTGEYLQPLDADDLLDPGCVAAAVAAIGSAVLAIPTLELIGASSGRTAPSFSSVGEFLSRQGIIQPLMRAEAVDRVGGYADDLAYGEDIELYLRLLTLGNPALAPEACYRYRIHEGQLTQQRSAREVPARAATMRRHLGLYQRHAPALWGALAAQFAMAEHFERRYGALDRLTRSIARRWPPASQRSH